MEIDKKSVLEWAKKYALCVDYMNNYGAPIKNNDYRNQKEMSESRLNFEGKYAYNAGVVAFVVDGKCYATPLVENAIKILNDSGFERTSSLGVPAFFTGGFPGILEDESVLWFDSNGEFRANPAMKVIEYYNAVKNQHTGYSRWVGLLKISGQYDYDPIIDRINEIKNDIDGYNQAAKELVEANLTARTGRHSR